MANGEQRFNKECRVPNDLVGYRVEKGVAIFELNDPPANTYTYEMNRELDAHILEARMDDDIHVIVIRGAGDKFFSAGANIKMLSEVTPAFKYNFCLHANETMLRLEHTAKLVIAALNGHTVGGGLEIALAADLRIARQGSGKIGLPEVSLGVLPGTGGTQRLSRLAGKSKAMQLMAEGNLIEFEQALAVGGNRVLGLQRFLLALGALRLAPCERTVQGAEHPFLDARSPEDLNGAEQCNS